MLVIAEQNALWGHDRQAAKAVIRASHLRMLDLLDGMFGVIEDSELAAFGVNSFYGLNLDQQSTSASPRSSTLHAGPSGHSRTSSEAINLHYTIPLDSPACRSSAAAGMPFRQSHDRRKSSVGECSGLAPQHSQPAAQGLPHAGNPPSRPTTPMPTTVSDVDSEEFERLSMDAFGSGPNLQQGPPHSQQRPSPSQRSSQSSQQSPPNDGRPLPAFQQYTFGPS